MHVAPLVFRPPGKGGEERRSEEGWTSPSALLWPHERAGRGAERSIVAVAGSLMRWCASMLHERSAGRAFHRLTAVSVLLLRRHVHRVSPLEPTMTTRSRAILAAVAVVCNLPCGFGTDPGTQKARERASKLDFFFFPAVASRAHRCGHLATGIPGRQEVCLGGSWP